MEEMDEESTVVGAATDEDISGVPSKEEQLGRNQEQGQSRAAPETTTELGSEREQALRKVVPQETLAAFAEQFGRQQEQVLRNVVPQETLAAFAEQFGRQQEQVLRNVVPQETLAAFAKQFGRQQEQLLRNAVPQETLAAFAKQLDIQRDQLYESVRSTYANLSAARSLHYPALKVVDANRTTAYSPEMTKYSTYFEQYESVVDSFEEFHGECSRLMDNHPEFSFLWRGQRDADWPLHSSLFRELWAANGVRGPEIKHRYEESFPTEADMVAAETAILEYIRENWRFDDTGALSTFARLQHFGAPTRLLDVSRNPLIAAWFATEAHEETDEKDCRLFALATATSSVTEGEREQQVRSSRVGPRDAGTELPFWHALESDEKREEYQWGTGRLRRFWVPPLYESRISAQNAAFILDGVPLDSPSLDKYFLKPGVKVPWKITDRLASSSISVRFSRTNRPVSQRISKQLPPTFTIRITSNAKREIRRVLKDRYSYHGATIYPDIQGAAQSIRSDLRGLIAAYS